MTIGVTHLVEHPVMGTLPPVDPSVPNMAAVRERFDRSRRVQKPYQAVHVQA
jgi:hypothetical protein